MYKSIYKMTNNKMTNNKMTNNKMTNNNSKIKIS